MKYFIENPEEIHKTVHATQEIMINSALSMYSTTYNNIADYCYEILHGLDFIFKGKDLRFRIKAVEGMLARQGQNNLYDSNEIKRILLESGLVGSLNGDTLLYTGGYDVAETRQKGHDLSNSFRVVVALFEYQVKGRLHLNDDSYYVIHPMCYEHFECRVLDQTLVFPERIDDTDVMNVHLRSISNNSDSWQ